MAIVVMGASGAGKTTIGRPLAGALDLPFLEGDDLHPQGNVDKMRAGIALDDADRLPWLEAVGAWLGEHDGVATCSALRRSYRDVLRRHAPDVVFVHLQTGADELQRRVAGRSGHYMPPTLVRSQIAVLEPLGPTERGIVIDVTDRDPLDVAAAAATALSTRARDPG